MDITFHEILEKVEKAKNKSERIQILRKHNSEALRQVLKAAFDPNIIWRIPPGEISYNKEFMPDGTGHSSLNQEAGKLYHYIVGGNTNIDNEKCMKMFIGVLECLDENEAQLLISAKDKKLYKRYKGLSVNVVKEAFSKHSAFQWENV